ncbi:hypothetical protein BOTBODRAFT_56548 [Botryobasidium botryosum FD-172 SS1]|uniref:Uncharacterized protein n=1 Tax=Botryobasidium botryosum (strain FD-172 SS1) TaxID=930990 RepID=A0A067MAF7_BOTB1|nr:hypothetical protein BOTBODRAFT_56548 [Botryobasidium botryosum FD-172 SS1]
MRWFTSFFAKRDKRPPPAPKPPSPPPDDLPFDPAPALSASSDISDASSLRTPDEDPRAPNVRVALDDAVPALVTIAAARPRGWRALIRPKRRPVSRKKAAHPFQADSLAVDWQPRRTFPAPLDPSSDEEEEEEDDEEDDDDEDFLSDMFTPLPPPLPNPHMGPFGHPPRSYTNLLAVTMSGLSCQISSHPLMFNPSLPLFPRSVNPHSTTSHAASSHLVHMLKSHVVQRLEGAPSRPLTRAEELSIRAFGTRPPRPLPARRATRLTEEEAIQRIGGNAGWSRGLKRWAERPCFEERVLVWIPDEFGGLDCSKVMASSRSAVAALEFSDGLEALSGLTGFLEAPQAAALKKPWGNLSTKLSRPSIAIPATPVLTPSSSASSSTPTTPRKSRGSDDDVPLGVMFLSSKRERADRERKAQEDKSSERRIKDDEKRQKRYAEDLAAARARRDIAKQGGIIGVEAAAHAALAEAEKNGHPNLRRSRTESLGSAHPRSARPLVHSASASAFIPTHRSSASRDSLPPFASANGGASRPSSMVESGGRRSSLIFATPVPPMMLMAPPHTPLNPLNIVPAMQPLPPFNPLALPDSLVPGVPARSRRVSSTSDMILASSHRMGVSEDGYLIESAPRGGSVRRTSTTGPPSMQAGLQMPAVPLPALPTAVTAMVSPARRDSLLGKNERDRRSVSGSGATSGNGSVRSRRVSTTSLQDAAGTRPTVPPLAAPKHGGKHVIQAYSRRGSIASSSASASIGSSSSVGRSASRRMESIVENERREEEERGNSNASNISVQQQQQQQQYLQLQQLQQLQQYYSQSQFQPSFVYPVVQSPVSQPQSPGALHRRYATEEPKSMHRSSSLLAADVAKSSPRIRKDSAPPVLSPWARTHRKSGRAPSSSSTSSSAVAVS